MFFVGFVWPCVSVGPLVVGVGGLVWGGLLLESCWKVTYLVCTLFGLHKPIYLSLLFDTRSANVFFQYS